MRRPGGYNIAAGLEDSGAWRVATCLPKMVTAVGADEASMMPCLPFAVLRLITSSNLVGCSTGMSAGFVPRRISSTKSAERRNRSAWLGP